MIWIAAGALGVAALTIIVCVELVNRMIRQNAREREQLLARIMHLADKTWEIPPSREVAETPATELTYAHDDFPAPGS